MGNELGVSQSVGSSKDRKLLDCGTTYYVSNLIYLAAKGFVVTKGDTLTIRVINGAPTLNGNPLPEGWPAQKKTVERELGGEKKVDKDNTVKGSKRLLNALDEKRTGSKYDIKSIVTALKGKIIDISADIETFAVGADDPDAILGRLIEKYNLDKAQFTVENAKAFGELKALNIKPDVTLQTIQDNIAYKALTASPSTIEPSQLSKENSFIFESAKKVVERLTAPSPQPGPTPVPAQAAPAPASAATTTAVSTLALAPGSAPAGQTAPGAPAQAPAQKLSPYQPMTIKTWWNVLRSWGCDIAEGEENKDFDGDKDVDVHDLEAYLKKEKGIEVDFEDKLQFKEAQEIAKAYDREIKKVGFDYIDAGGRAQNVSLVTKVVDPSKTDGGISLEEYQAFMRESVADIAQGVGKEKEVITQFLDADKFEIVDKDKAAGMFWNKYSSGNESMTYEAFMSHVADKLKPMVNAILLKILGVEKLEANTTVAKAQAGNLFVTLSFLGQLEKPKELFDIGGEFDYKNLIKETEADKFLAAFTSGTKDAMKAEKKEGEKAGEKGNVGEGESKTDEDPSGLGLTPLEMTALRQSQRKGASAFREKLEELSAKNPTNIMLKEMLVDEYNKSENYEKSVNLLLELNKTEPTPDRKKLLIGVIQKYIAKATGQAEVNVETIRKIEAGLNDLGAIDDVEAAANRTQLVLSLAKLKKKLKTPPADIQKFIDDNMAPIYASKVWDGNEGQKGAIALEIARAKSGLFIDRKEEEKTYSIGQGLKVDKEIEIMLKSWHEEMEIKTASGNKKVTLSAQLNAARRTEIFEKLDSGVTALSRDDVNDLFILYLLFTTKETEMRAKYGENTKGFNADKKTTGDAYKKCFASDGKTQKTKAKAGPAAPAGGKKATGSAPAAAGTAKTSGSGETINLPYGKVTITVTKGSEYVKAAGNGNTMNLAKKVNNSWSWQNENFRFTNVGIPADKIAEAKSKINAQLGLGIK